MFDRASRTVRVRTTCGCIDSAGGEKWSLSSLSDEWQQQQPSSLRSRYTSVSEVTDRRPYLCMMCPKQFASAAVLRSHVGRHVDSSITAVHARHRLMSHRCLATGNVHSAGSATYQICFRLPIPYPNPNPNSNPSKRKTKRHRNKIQHRVISKS